jgi:hypothetical protein
MYTATVVRINNVMPHPNADRLALTRIFGNNVVISKDTNEGDLGIYFPSDGQLSHEYVRANNLYSSLERNADPTQKGYFDEKRRVRAQAFRGVKSDGMWMPISSLVTFSGISESEANVFEDGTDLVAVNGVALCNKYVPVGRQSGDANSPKQAKKVNTSPMFREHFDTAPFSKHVFDIISGHGAKSFVITEKVHGTSGRVCYGVVNGKVPHKNFVQNVLSVAGNHNKLVSLFTKPLSWAFNKVLDLGHDKEYIDRPEYRYIHGSRRVVLKDTTPESPVVTNEYHSRGIRDFAMSLFRDKLRKGETVFFEIVGFEPTGASIMPSAGISPKEFDKDFVRQYGAKMTYSYGCSPDGLTAPQCAVYVYRMTVTNEDGESVDLPWKDVVSRCDQMRVNVVPVLCEGVILDSRVILTKKCAHLQTPSSLHLTDHRDIVVDLEDNLVKKLAEGPSVLDSSHIKEGICFRVEDSALVPSTYKYKSYEFKVLEGIVKDSGVLDQEEANSEGLVGEDDQVDQLDESLAGTTVTTTV